MLFADLYVELAALVDKSLLASHGFLSVHLSWPQSVVRINPGVGL